MKILFVIDCLGSGGAQRQIVNLAVGLKSRGYIVEFFIYYPHLVHFQKTLVANGISIHISNKKNKLGLSVIFNLRKLVIANRYHWVISFLDTPNFYSEIATLGLKDVFLLVSERFMYPPGRLPLKLFILQQLHRIADVITVNSHHQRERMIIQFPWMRRKLCTIYNGVDLVKFNNTSTLMNNNINQLNIIAIASVSSKKNAKSLIEAIRICRSKYDFTPMVTWVGSSKISGEGDKYFKEAESLLVRYGLSENWAWVGESSEIPHLLNINDILVHPSFYEGLPNVVCEALASGRPVIASNVCEHPYIIKEGENGYLFDPSSPSELAMKINKYYTLDLSIKKMMGLQARKYAVEYLSLNKYVSSYQSLLT